MPLRAFRQHSLFWPILARFMAVNHRFGVLEQFPQLTIPEVRLRVGHQHSQIWPILACFVYYYSLFWGPGVISTINTNPGVRLPFGHQH